MTQSSGTHALTVLFGTFEYQPRFVVALEIIRLLVTSSHAASRCAPGGIRVAIMPTARIGNAGGTRLLTLIQVARERQPSLQTCRAAVRTRKAARFV